MILNLLGFVPTPVVPSSAARGASSIDPPGGASDLDIRRGGPGSSEVVLIDMKGHLGNVPERLAAAWSSVGPQNEQPWVVVARSAAAADGVLAYFDHAPGEQPEHDAYMKQVESILPWQITT